MAALKTTAKRAERATAASGPESVQYMADLLLELRNMAARGEHKFLTYLLEMAFYEAFSLANRVDLGPADLEHLLLTSLQSRDAPPPPEAAPPKAS